MYQCGLVQDLTYIVAKSYDLGRLIYMLNADWQFDTSNLLTKFVKMKEPKIAPLQEGRILA
ncbi:Transmembrane protein 132B [Microtus ochrogaster]|uniref:Transmembrane protein 132B n=1 Tax=Microtus ochrogaster TaxID=79684 RepID=A0A8J6GUS0_MICOH|nr:Transmembrane protein 132B [Microtus ochrogaster]